MLSLFPEFLNYSQLAPFVIRLALALIFLSHGYTKFFKSTDQMVGLFESKGMKPGKIWLRLIGVIEMACGVLFFVGFWTQLAAILVAVIMLGAIIKVRWKEGFLGAMPTGRQGFEFEFLILICALSLLVLGPGVFSIDLPL